MKIRQIQHQCVVSPAYHYNRPNGLDEYVLVLSHGQAWFHADGVKYLLEPYQLFIYDKYQPQLFYSTGEDFRHDWFHFDMTKNDRAFFDTLDIPFGKPITLPDPYILSELIKTLASEHAFHAPHREQIIDLYMRCFFMKLSDMLHNPVQENSDHPYYQCLCSLRNELYGFPYYDWSLETMAKKAHMSKSWLQHNWKEVFGCCYQDDLIKSRVEYAKNLLFHTEETIERIAFIVGYNNSTHFMRQFKKATGLTPSAYREKFSNLDKPRDTLVEFEQPATYNENHKKRREATEKA